MSVIQTENLKKYFGQVRAVDGLSLTIEAGTIFGFLGPNGAGKTTTIRLLTGLTKPTAGRAWVAGEDITHSHRIAHRIGYLPEEPAFYPWMTPVELLDYIARLFGLPMTERKARIQQLLDQVGLSHAAKRRIGGFSKGMRQRLGLAQALINRPEIVFLDEPVSALDPAGRKEILDMIAGLRGQCTVFMSTHILDDVERVCDTVGIINHGQMLVVAPQGELRARYAIPAFEVECVPNAEEALAAWAGTLRRQQWVKAVTVNGPVARIMVEDVAVARLALLAEIVRAGLIVQRYEVVRPSLEDVFLRIVRQEEGSA